MEYSLTNLTKLVLRRKKRLGRGSGSGKGDKSTKGTTRHQGARENIPLSFEGGQGRVIKKFPLLRGKGKNNAKRERPAEIAVEKLNAFSDNDQVTLTTLVEKGLISNKVIRVKVIGPGSLTRKLIVSVPVTRSVQQMIEKAGGEVRKV